MVANRNKGNSPLDFSSSEISLVARWHPFARLGFLWILSSLSATSLTRAFALLATLIFVTLAANRGFIFYKLKALRDFYSVVLFTHHSHGIHGVCVLRLWWSWSNYLLWKRTSVLVEIRRIAATTFLSQTFPGSNISWFRHFLVKTFRCHNNHAFTTIFKGNLLSIS